MHFFFGGGGSENHHVERFRIIRASKVSNSLAKGCNSKGCPCCSLQVEYHLISIKYRPNYVKYIVHFIIGVTLFLQRHLTFEKLLVSFSCYPQNWSAIFLIKYWVKGLPVIHFFAEVICVSSLH